MTQFSPNELAAQLKDGLLSFPVTSTKPDLTVDLETYRKHIEWQSSFNVAGLFAAGGTGEGFSLTPQEHFDVIRTAVQSSSANVPVLGSAIGNTAQAIATARASEEAGAEGLLLLPPYLSECSQEGLFKHVSAVCEAVNIAVIIYNRANAEYAPATVARLAAKHENFIGFKDANGNIEELAKVIATNGERLFYLSGLPCAETFALPLLQMGVSTYSSALFNFLPEFALDFYTKVRANDTAAVSESLRTFVLPYLDIRDRENGFGVSIVKAGLRAIGRDNGGVRPPLRDLNENELWDLRELIETNDLH